MSNIILPRNALEKIQVGQAFAEYDLIRTGPHLFVTTPATLAAFNQDDSRCFFIGRRSHAYQQLRRVVAAFLLDLELSLRVLTLLSSLLSLFKLTKK